MKPILLACDVDGTLLPQHSQIISKEDLSAIKKFREKGNVFSLCTGRTVTWTLPLLEENKLHCDALILSNGSDIHLVDKEDPYTISRINLENLSAEICKEVVNYFYNTGEFTICWDDGEKTYEMNDRLLDQETSIIQESEAELVSIDDFQKNTLPLININLAPLNGSVEKALSAKEFIISKWGTKVDVFRNQFFIDVTPKNSSKGTGILKLVSHLSFDGDLYGIGDSYNDIPMFETLGKNHSFVMNNAEHELKSYGTNVPSVAECISILLGEK